MGRHGADAFEREIRNQVEYFRREFTLTYTEAVGVLELVKGDIIREALDLTHDGDNDPDL